MTHFASNVMIKKLLKAMHAFLAVKDVTNALVQIPVRLVDPTPLSQQTSNVLATMVTSGTLIRARASSVAAPVQHVSTALNV